MDVEPDLRHEPRPNWYFLRPGSPDQDSACPLLASKSVSTSSAASASTAHRRCPSESYQRLAFHDTKPMAFLNTRTRASANTAGMAAGSLKAIDDGPQPDILGPAAPEFGHHAHRESVAPGSPCLQPQRLPSTPPLNP